MNCLITAGPTQEPLDQVRRLTNHSTGALGSLFANFLESHGHTTTLLLGQGATFPGPHLSLARLSFSSTADLKNLLSSFSPPSRFHAVFHAAAVSDFTFGKVYQQEVSGQLTPLHQGKFSTREGPLLAELLPTPKLISMLHSWFPHALRVGWKYEVDGSLDDAQEKALQQITANHTHACVLNGPAYGPGFGILTPPAHPTTPLLHCPTPNDLFQNLLKILQSHSQQP